MEAFPIGMCLHSAKFVVDANGPLLVQPKRLKGLFSFLKHCSLSLPRSKPKVPALLLFSPRFVSFLPVESGFWMLIMPRKTFLSGFS